MATTTTTIDDMTSRIAQPPKESASGRGLGPTPVIQSVNVFMSHSDEDAPLVNMCVDMLEIHGLKVWCSSKDLKAGQLFPEQITNALACTDSLIVMVSKNSARSIWVQHEVSTFQKLNPGCPMIPVSLDSTRVEEIFAGLGSHQGVSLSPSIRDGFVDLLSAFGKRYRVDISANEERRKVKNRRVIEERRIGDRRKHSTLVRFRNGLWKSFHNATGIGKFQPLHSFSGLCAGYGTDLSRTSLDHYKIGAEYDNALRESLLVEVCRYDYRDKRTGRQLSGQIVLNMGLSYAFTRAKEYTMAQCVPVRAIELVEIIAEYICGSYSVEQRDRRGRGRRISDRRKAEAAKA